MPKFFCVLLAVVIPITPIAAQHAVKGEFQEMLHAKADKRLPEYKPSGAVTGPIRSVGADTMEVLMKLWTADFKRVYPGVEISIEAKASGTAGPALTEGMADIGPVAREMLPAEVSAFVARFGYKPTAIRVAGGSYRTPGKTHSICFFVNSQNPIRQLSFDQVDALFSRTHRRGGVDARTWGDVGLTGEWASKPVHLWGLIRPNGIAHFLEDRILMGGEWKDGIHERTTVGSLAALDAVAQGVAADPYAIGYAGFGNQIPGIKTVALAESKSWPYLHGSFEEVVAQKYPLSRVIYIYINRAPAKPIDPKVREFLAFVLSRQGQIDVEKEGIFLPLPLAMAQQELGKLN
jgi:phosphate transport system substrate-binding protein